MSDRPDWGDRWRGWLAKPATYTRAFVIGFTAIVVGNEAHGLLPADVNGLLLLAGTCLIAWDWRYQRWLRKERERREETDETSG